VTGPTARFPVIANGAYAAPGVCKFCGRSGNSDERGMTDSGHSDDFYGVVYICSYCVLEMAEQYGAASPATMLRVLSDGHQRDLRLKGLSDRLDKAEGVLNALGAIGLLDLSDAALSEPAVVSQAETLPFVSDEDTDGTSDTGEEPQLETDESDSVEGPHDPSGLTGATTQQWDDIFG